MPKRPKPPPGASDPTIELSESQLLPVSPSKPRGKPVAPQDVSMWKGQVLGGDDFAPAKRRAKGSWAGPLVGVLVVGVLIGAGVVVYRALTYPRTPAGIVPIVYDASPTPDAARTPDARPPDARPPDARPDAAPPADAAPPGDAAPAADAKPSAPATTPAKAGKSTKSTKSTKKPVKKTSKSAKSSKKKVVSKKKKRK
jgi:hypothetical protein